VGESGLRVVDGHDLGSFIAGTHGPLNDIKMTQRVQDPDTVSDILFRGTPLFTGLEVIDKDPFTKIGEGDAVALHDNIVLWGPACKEELGRRRAYRILDEIGRKSDDPGFSIHPGPRPLQDVDRFFILHEEAGMLHHFKRGQVNLVKLVLGDNIEAEASAELLACM
jgi:hypothetical protein